MSRENYYCAIITSRGVDIPLKTSRYVLLNSLISCAIAILYFWSLSLSIHNVQDNNTEQQYYLNIIYDIKIISDQIQYLLVYFTDFGIQDFMMTPSLFFNTSTRMFRKQIYF